MIKVPISAWQNYRNKLCGDIRMSEKYGEIPKNFWGKVGHYWYYYKWMIIAGICVLGLVVLFFAQVVFRTKADYTIILGMNTYVMDEQVMPLKDHLEQYAEDINGDGKVKIDMYNMTGDLDDVQNRSLQTNRFFSEMQLGKVMIVITDEDFYNFIKGDDIFQPNEEGADAHGYNWAGTEIQQQCIYFPENLYFNIRKIEGTSLEQNDKSAQRHAAAEALIDKMIHANAVSDQPAEQ